MANFYKWTREKYVRNTPKGRWKLVPEETEITYCTEPWMEEKVGKAECRFWRAIGSWVRVKRNPYYGHVLFTNIAPSKLEKREERFDPIWIKGDALNMGHREREALTDCHWHQHLIPVVEETDEHLVLGIGEGECRANLDIKQMRWV